MQLISDPLIQWLSLHIPMSGEMQQNKSIIYQLHCLWTEILSCLRRSQPAIVFDTVFLEVQAPLLRASLDHFHLPISEASIAFWRDMQSQKAVLNYPQCLLSILEKLSRSGRISLHPENKSNFDNNGSAAEKAPGLAHKRILRTDAAQGPHPSQGSVHIFAPGFRIKRLKITSHPSNLNEVPSAHSHNHAVLSDCEGKLENRRADNLLKKLKRA